MTFQMNDDEWLMRQLELEGDDDCVLAGNLVRVPEEEVEKILSSPMNNENSELTDTTRQLALAKLIKHARWERGMTLPEFAELADVDEQELLAIEKEKASYIAPRTVYQLSQILQISNHKLGALAGILQPRETRLKEATIQFAANTETACKLSPEQQEELHEFVALLSEGD